MHLTLEQIVHTITHATESLEQEMIEKSDLQELTTRQLACIELISNLKNPSLSELAAEMQIARASISVMADRLERNGFIKKVTSDKDRRTAHVHLTKTGKKAAKLHSDVHRRISEMLMNKLTETETEILITLLNKAVSSLKEKQESSTIIDKKYS